MLAPTIDLYSPDTYVDAPPHAEFERLRRDEPITWVTMPDGTGYWLVLRHADVVTVARETKIFSAELGGVVVEDLAPESLVAMRQMLLAMDPPRHVAHRRNVSPQFRVRVIAGLEGRIREICCEIMDRAEARADDGATIDFVHDVAAHLPSQVVGELMGLPREDWPAIHAMAERNSGGQDPDINPDGADRSSDDLAKNAASASIDMAMYAIGFAAKRREAPRQDDLTSLILESEVDGRPMTDAEFGSFFVQLVTAGNDTTRTMLSSGLDALLDHPETFEHVRSNRADIPGMVEEVLRWANPLHYFRRTTTEATELGGQPIEAGQKVAMCYTSANRDASVFDDPHTFDITRDPNPHLSFGVGEHFCLGAHLARLEGRVFFEELFDRFSVIERRGPSARQRSNLNNSLKGLPVSLASSP
ncbi:MAG: cytochrome P450 [Acidimicrobiales bacterium]|nr:cytochrome P450 [Acidimicrobiales bacterium]